VRRDTYAFIIAIKGA